MQIAHNVVWWSWLMRTGKEKCLPAKRFHKIFFQKVVIFFHWSNVNGELRIWVDESMKSVIVQQVFWRWMEKTKTKLLKTAFLLNCIKRTGWGGGAVKLVWYVMLTRWDRICQNNSTGACAGITSCFGYGSYITGDSVQTIWIEHSITFMRSR